jgi:hypothetical protein
VPSEFITVDELARHYHTSPAAVEAAIVARVLPEPAHVAGARGWTRAQIQLTEAVLAELFSKGPGPGRREIIAAHR